MGETLIRRRSRRCGYILGAEILGWRRAGFLQRGFLPLAPWSPRGRREGRERGRFRRACVGLHTGAWVFVKTLAKGWPLCYNVPRCGRVAQLVRARHSH